ncbi:MAG: multicopper oxidase domain-containing protein [Gammaproteobacteria bacterium]
MSASAALAATGGLLSGVNAQPLPGGTLDPTTIPKYVQPLVIPPVMDDTGTANDYDIAVRQFQQQILPGGHWNAVSPACQSEEIDCNLPPTTVWSYGPAADSLPDSSGIDGGALGVAPALNSQFNYPAFTVENTVGDPTKVDWINDLKENFGAGPKFLQHPLPIDQTLHWANPGADCLDGTPRTDCRGSSKVPYRGPVPIVTHVHGAHVDPESDGYPEAWWLPDPTGSNFSCVDDPAEAVNGFYVCAGTLANGYGIAANTNAGDRLGVGQYEYRNDQPSTTLWYHDHTLGMTRNNVYAGPAGFWLIRESGGGETGLISGTLPGPAPVAGDDPNFDAATREAIREVPIVIQDRSFNDDGSLFYPDNRAFFEGVDESLLNVNFIPQSDISPIWNPEAFFNTMVVNGTTWPVLDVAQAKYRFRLLNGCNSRFLNLAMFVVNPNGTLGAEIPFYQIGAEQSLLPAVVEVKTGFKNGAPASHPQEALVMGLAERADVIVDFGSLAQGTRVRMLNTGPDEPFGGFPVDAPADPHTTGQVMEFVINTALNGKSPTDPGPQPDLGDPDGSADATAPGNLVLSLPDAGDPAALPGPGDRVRDLALLEEESQEVCVRVKPNGQIAQIRKVKPGPSFFADCFTAGGEPFGPKAAVLGWQGSTNPTVTLWSDDVVTNPGLGDTETWEFWNVSADAHPIHLHLVKFKVTGRGFDGTQPPAPTEAGWKDTVIALPGEVTRVKATFDIPGLYVWHCHIVEHEDNEMMVPYCVGSQNGNGCQNLGFDPDA